MQPPANDNRRARTRADEQFVLIGILGCMVLFIAITWLAG
jgi:hypothetical protein